MHVSEEKRGEVKGSMEEFEGEKEGNGKNPVSNMLHHV